MKVADLNKYKTDLYSSLSRDLDAFEKNFILIASGLLGFSITFINDIVKIENATYLWILLLGWLLILAAVGVMMYAFLSSVNGSNKLWKITDDFIIANNLYKADDDVTALMPAFKTSIKSNFDDIKKRLSLMRAWAVGIFLAGVLLFGTFVSINLYRENSKGVNKTSEKQKTKTEIIVDNATVTTTDSLVIINSNCNQPKGNCCDKKPQHNHCTKAH